MSTIEDLFGKLAMTTVTTVSRIALSHATNAAIRNVTSYITTQLPKNKPDTKEIRALQRQLDLKVKNLKPTIDIIARSVADGNRDLESALEMCNDLKSDMNMFATQVEKIEDPDQVKQRLRRLLANVDEAIPSLHLSLRSIESKTGTTAVSPGKLVQASNILRDTTTTVFPIKLYSLFAANQRAASAEAFTWKEEFHKAELVVKNNNTKEKRDYRLYIVEDTNDGLYHEKDEEKQELTVNVNQIERMYYTQSGQLLNIEDSKTPVLVLKVAKKLKEKIIEENVVQIKESAPEIIQEELQESDWYALGLWSTEDEENEDDSSESEEEAKSTKSSSSNVSPENLNLNLSLLESIIKLALLETTEQMNHLYASDELINLYMK